MSWRTVVLCFCLGLGVQVTGVRSSVNLDDVLEQTEVAFRSSPCDDGKTPPDHFDKLVDKGLKDPNLFYDVITEALLGYTELGLELKKDPPQVDLAYVALATRLWNCVVRLIDEEDQKSEYVKNAKSQWDQGWANAPSIETKIRAFQKTGNFSQLVSALYDVADTSLSVAESTMCSKAYTKLFTGTKVLMNGVTNATHAFMDGETTEALKNLWNGINSSVQIVVDKEDREDSKWFKFYEKVDARVSEFFEFVVEWNLEALKSPLCHRISEPRQTRPAISCPNGYTWDQISLCKPDVYHGINCSNACPDAIGKGGGTCKTFCGFSGSNPRYCCKKGFGEVAECQNAQYVSLDGGEFTDASKYFQCVDPVIFGLLEIESKNVKESMLHRATVHGKRSSLDNSAARKCFFGWCWGKEHSVEQDKYGSRVPVCDPLSHFPDSTLDGRCSSKCLDGWTAEGDNCLSDCSGTDKAHEGKLGFAMGDVKFNWPVCALSQTHLQISNANLAKVAINTAAAIQKAVAEYINSTLSEETIDATIETMKKVANKFAVPQCEEQ